MRRVFSFFLTFIVIIQVSGQMVISNNNNALYTSNSRSLPLIGAAPVSNSQYVDLKEGSPFFQKEWVKGTLVSKAGASYTNVSVKLNLMDNRVHYLDSTGREVIVGTELVQMVFPQKSVGSNVHFVHGSVLPDARNGWFQLLVNDSITLLKSFKKELSQHTSYGSPTEYSVNTQEFYILYYKGKAQEIKKPLDITQLAIHKRSELEAFLKKMEKASKEKQLILVTNYANSLLKQ